jgi:translation initiation factor 3 subunit F
MAAAVADSPPPTTYGCSPALLLNSATSSSTTARSSVAAALAVGTGGAGASDAAGAELLPVSNVNVHPLVLLSVLDHHSRRQEGAGRVIGTLLGKRDGGEVRFALFFA